VPFRKHLLPKLNNFLIAFPGSSQEQYIDSIAVDSVRLKQQVIYFSVAGQIFQANEEYFAPYIIRKKNPGGMKNNPYL